MTVYQCLRRGDTPVARKRADYQGRSAAHRHGAAGVPPPLGVLMVAALLMAALGVDAAPAPLKPVAAKASSVHEKYDARLAIDGVISDASRWVSVAASGPAWLEVQLAATSKLAGVHLHTGYGEADAIRAGRLQFWQGGQWRDIPSAAFANNDATAIALPFDDAVEVLTDRLRLLVTEGHEDRARVKEIVIWPAGQGDLPALAGARMARGGPAKPAAIPLIYLNQSGFNLGQPKRFTAPTLADGTRFEVKPAAGGVALYAGAIAGHVGDFSAFNPTGTGDYMVTAGGQTSVPFGIGPWWLERVTYQGAVDFMVDSRHYVGNDRSPCGGSFGWRDDHHFGWELHTLVPQYLSNPSAYERMPRQIRYEKPTKPGLWGALTPYKEEAPDLVKLIHWGADVIVSQQLGHEHLKAQLAYFLYAWPVLEPWLPRQNYDAVRDYAFRTWGEKAADRKYPYDESTDHDLLALKTKVGSTKGALPPGFSVEPNLLMYEVAKRERRPDAEQYFQAAHKQAAWMIANLDWDDPLTTKGQRMSEFLTLTGLGHFLRVYPDRAPAGLAAKIEAWAKVAFRRAENLWDFRKLDDGAKWTPMGEKPTMWNEPGNVLGLPAALLAAREVLPDPKTKARLTELVWSHFDNGFGRNPVGRHFSYDAPREIEGVEFGWFKFLPGGIGRLANARFVIDGSPKDGHYPYHPEKGDFGWTEGWIQFNTPFNLSLAWLAYAETRIELRRAGDELVVRLRAPLNLDARKVEAGTVVVTLPDGTRMPVVVTEDSPNAEYFGGRCAVKAAAGTTIEASYGYGYLGRRASLRW